MSLVSIAKNIGLSKKDDQREDANIIEFIESNWGLGFNEANEGMVLFPVQKILLKAHYGIPLDNKVKFPIPKDWMLEKFYQMTEADYIRYLYNEGRCNLPEVVPDDDRRTMILAVGRRSGKCVTGDSLVLTSEGIVRIDEIGDPFGPQWQPLEVQVAQEKSKRANSAFFYVGGRKPTRRLQTWCGYSIEGTYNHRVKVLDPDGVVRWKFLEKIQKGDVLALHRKTDLWAQDLLDVQPYRSDRGRKKLNFPTHLNEDWGQLLGILVGDGGWTYEALVATTVEDPECWEIFSTLYQKLFGEFSITPDKRTANTGRLAFFSVGMREFLHNLGWKIGTAKDAKMVPWSILRSPKPVVKAFLRGLFETDGGIEKGGQVVAFSTASQRLASEVQILLLNLGIVTRNHPKWNKTYQRYYYHVTVRGLRSRRTFAEEIGFLSNRKNDPLQRSVRESAREGGNTESIPHQHLWCKKLVASVPTAKPGKGWSKSILREALGNTIKPSSKEDLTYPRLRKVFDVCHKLTFDEDLLQHFQDLADLDYFFDEVSSIGESEAEVYDLNVPDGASFVANGFVNHNTTLSAAIVAYEIYKLIQKQNPHGYFGIPNSNLIQMTVVATGKEQAEILYNEASEHFRKCSFFRPYTAKNTLSYAMFQTPQDLDEFGAYEDNQDARMSIRVTFKSCVARGLRGHGNLIVIMDEAAHFAERGQSGAEQVYNAVNPSMSAFSPKHKGRPIGPVESRLIEISSPLGRTGHFYKQFRIGFEGGPASEDYLCVQAPTWEVNPTIPAREYDKHFRIDPEIFHIEYGAQFSDKTRSWIEREEDLEACIDLKLAPKVNAPALTPHFIGIDVGLKQDGSALAIGHIDEHKNIVLDVMDWIRPGDPGPYVDLEHIPLDEISKWVQGYTRKFYIVEGIFDQYVGIVFEDELKKKGISNLHSVHMTKNLNSDIFKNFKTLMYERRLALFNYPLPQGQAYCDYIEELLRLQATRHSKHVVTVEAPNLKGHHDDRSDALVRMVWVASQHLGKDKYIAKGIGSDRHVFRDDRFKQRRQRLRGGTHPSRQKPRRRR